MTGADQAASALTNIPAAMAVWLILGAGCAITVAGIGLVTAIRAACRLLRSLMDARDGQGGIPPLPRRQPATRAMDLGGLVIPPHPHADRCAWCDDLTEMGEVDDCGCPGPCGKAWCGKRRNPVPASWTDRPEGIR